MEQKKCFKCNETKDLSLFYKHKQMCDGHLGKCKECTKKDATDHRNANLEKIRQYDLDRAKLPHRKDLATKCRKKFRKEHPLASPAHSMVQRAVRDGKLVKPSKCQNCNKEKKVYAHHDDYYKPLDVKWLCQVCHKKEHKLINERKLTSTTKDHFNH